MRSSDATTLALVGLGLFLVVVIFWPRQSFRLSYPTQWWPSWNVQPRSEPRLGPGGGIQTGGTVRLPAHPVPWLGPGGVQTGGTIHSPMPHSLNGSAGLHPL